MSAAKVAMSPREILAEFIKEFGWDASLVTLSDDQKTINMYSFDESRPPRTYHGLKVVQHV